MAAPVLGNFVGLFVLVLILCGGDAFRIRDGGLASSEQTRPTCNPLLGMCTDKTLVSTAPPTTPQRRKFDGVSALPRITKNQPPVETDNGEQSGLNQAKKSPSKLDKVLNVKISDHVKLQFKTASVPIGGSRAGLKLKVTRVESDEDDEDSVDGTVSDEDEDMEEDYERDDDGDDDTGIVNEDDDGDDNDNDESESEEEDRTNELESESERTEDEDDDNGDDDDDDDDDDEDDDDDNDDNDDDDDDDDDDNDDDQSDTNEDKLNDEKISQTREGEAVDSEYDDDTGDESENDNLRKKDVGKVPKQDEAIDRDTLKSVGTKGTKAIEKHMKENSEIVNPVSKRDTEAEEEDSVDNKKKGDNVDSSDSHVTKAGSKAVVIAKPEPAKTKDVKDSIDSGSDDDESNDVSDPEDPSASPPRKLEKVRLADKTKSMESMRTTSEEVEFAKFQSKRSMEDTNKVETVKTTKSSVQQTTSKPASKPQEKMKAPVKAEVQKPKVEVEKKEPPKSENKSKQQPKQIDQTKVKPPGVKSTSKPQPEQPESKPNAKPKKSSEASITLPELNDLILQLPSFTPNFTAIEDPVCQQHGKIFLRQLRGYKLWALQMLDSNAKIPSGLLRGNVNQLGDFDQCLGIAARVKVDEKTVKVQGKYCLATVDLYATRPDMKVPVNLMQSRAFVRGNMHDPGHFVPRFTTVNWALCFPAACSAQDAKTVMEEALKPYNVSAGLKFTVAVDPDMCYVRHKSQSYSKETVGVLYFYAMTLCLTLIATLRDYCVTSERKGSYSERIIMAFSLRRTTNALFRTDEHGSDIRCIHGIRAIATIALYVAHKLIPISRVPYANRISLTEAANNPLSSVLRASLVYTDSFLLLSGVLTAYNMSRELIVRGEIRWFCRFITRFIRLTPALLAVVFWYAFVMEHVGSGPQWNSVIKANADLCKENAWTNLLYIQNFFPFEEMCATHTHQLALDMQLTLIAPVLVFILHCKPVIGILVIIFFMQVSATVRYLATMNNYLSLVIFHGMTLKHLYKTANLTYALPLHRATPYLFGVGLGVLLHYTGKNVRLHKAFVILGWLAASALGSWSLFSPWRLAKRDYVYDAEEATNYAVLSPVAWALALCWVIFASFTDHGGIINKILSNHWLLIFSRMSYAVYLTQFAVFFYNVGTTRYASEFQVLRGIDLFEAATVIVSSISLTLLLDLPMQEVKNVIMESTDGVTIEELSDQKGKDETKEQSEKPLEGDSGETENFADDEVASTGWDWQKDIVEGGQSTRENLKDEEPREAYNVDSSQSRKKSFMRHDAQDIKEVPTWDWVQKPHERISREDDAVLVRGRRSRSSQRPSPYDHGDDAREVRRPLIQQQLEEDNLRRERRSQSRTKENKISSVKNTEEPPWDLMRRERSSWRAVDGKKYSAIEPEETSSREFMRRERSESKGRDNKLWSSMKEPEEQPSWEFVKRERSTFKAFDGRTSSVKGMEQQETPLRLSRGSLSTSNEKKRIPSSEEEEEPPPRLPKESSSRSNKPKRIQSSEEEEEPRPRSLRGTSSKSIESKRTPPSEEGQEPSLKLSRSSLSKKNEPEMIFSSEDELELPSRLSRGSAPRLNVQPRILSSESDEEPLRRHQSEREESSTIGEPRVSDDENWENELRLRRKKLAGNLASQATGTVSEEEEWSILRRRSSAEGKMALLNDSPEIVKVGSWSINKVPQISQFRSIQEPSESDEGNAYVITRKTYRETRPPFREYEETQSEEDRSWDPPRRRSYTSGSQPTSVDEEDASTYDFVLKKDSKRISVQNLSQLSHEEIGFDGDSGWDIVKGETLEPNSQTTSTGLFKRESIVKSQASEEDPEYLLPERPKLVEQEKAHPFKKAWQMQKSRSEEEGPTTLIPKDNNPRSGGFGSWKDISQREDPASDKQWPSGEQAEDVNYFGGDERESMSRHDTASEDVDFDSEENERLPSSKPETDEENVHFSWSGEDEQFTSSTQERRRSEESNWDWEQEET